MKTQEFTGFQRDALFVIAELGDPKGLEVKSKLEDIYDQDVNHGRLYPNLDELNDAGLVEVGSKDKRTNEYTLSEEGEEMLEDYVAWGESCISE